MPLQARPSVSVQNQVRASKEERTMTNVEMTVEGTLLTIQGGSIEGIRAVGFREDDHHRVH